MRRCIAAHPGDPRPLVDALDQRLRAAAGPLRIAIFAALPGEPDLAPLTARLPQHHWHYPRVAGDLLTFHRVTDPASDLAQGAFGIAEPSACLPATAVGELDLFICPGLAFDRRGGRLGRGRGFYDRMLAASRTDALKIGVGHAYQLVDDTMSAPHDIAMDEVLCLG